MKKYLEIENYYLDCTILCRRNTITIESSQRLSSALLLQNVDLIMAQCGKPSLYISLSG